MLLSIVIPVYNEQSTILELLKRVESVNLGDVEKEIIIVDDCSNDGTRDVLKNLEDRFRVFYHSENLGKGAALRLGFLKVRGDIVLIQDADLEYDPNDYPRLIKPIVENDADVVYGSRFGIYHAAVKNFFINSFPIIWKRLSHWLKTSDHSLSNDDLKAVLAASHDYQKESVYYSEFAGRGDEFEKYITYFAGYLANQLLTLFSNLLSGLKLSDIYTCYKVFSKDALNKIYPNLTSNRFGVEPELTALVAKNKLRIKEINILYQGRRYKQGKKINWKDGIAAIFHIIRYNLFEKK